MAGGLAQQAAGQDKTVVEGIGAVNKDNIYAVLEAQILEAII